MVAAPIFAGAWAADGFDSIGGKTAAAIAGGAAGIVGGTVASVIFLPAAPYFMAKSLMRHFDKNNSKQLEKAFSQVAHQMGRVHEHLSKIKGALGNIKYNLEKTRKAEDKAMKQLLKGKDGNATVKRYVDRVVKQADLLISTCHEYFDLINKDPSASKKFGEPDEIKFIPQQLGNIKLEGQKFEGIEPGSLEELEVQETLESPVASVTPVAPDAPET